MAYRNKVFVSFDGDNDIHYYRLMRAWKQDNNIPFNFFDAHDIITALDTSLESAIKRRHSKRIANTKAFVILIGQRTKYLYKFVRWELKQALMLDLPIIGVNLNKLRVQDRNLCPAIIRHELAIYVSFNARILQFALEDWPIRHRDLISKNVKGPHYYTNIVYERLRL